MSAKTRLKKFFGATEGSDAAVELLRMFILPFSRKYKGRHVAIDDVISDFFNVDTRKFYYATANDSFKMPGIYLTHGKHGIEGYGPRAVKKGQQFLMVIDKVTKQTRIESDFGDKYCSYMLTQPELETIKDYLDVKEA